VRNVVKDLTAEISEKVPLRVARARVCAKFRPVVWGDGARKVRWMARSQRPVALLSEATGDRIQSSVRYREVIGPLGLMYEARSVCTMGGELWGAIDLARERGRPDFSAREVMLLRRIAPHLGAGLKAAVLRSQASAETNSDGALGVLILDNRGRV